MSVLFCLKTHGTTCLFFNSVYIFEDFGESYREATVEEYSYLMADVRQVTNSKVSLVGGFNTKKTCSHTFL